MTVKELLGTCLNVMLPAICVCCRENSASYPLPICHDCKDLILHEFCPPVLFSENIIKTWSVKAYNGAVQKCIKHLKYNGEKALLPVIEELLKNYITSEKIENEHIDLIIPVPIHPLRRMVRGFNQTELIASALSSFLHFPMDSKILLKTKNTTSQMRLSRKERIANLDGSFTVVNRLALVGKRILLIDDIMTTGATLGVCAKELLKAGASEVCALTVARTL